MSKQQAKPVDMIPKQVSAWYSKIAKAGHKKQKKRNLKAYIEQKRQAGKLRWSKTKTV
jgi:hypothetical protein